MAQNQNVWTTQQGACCIRSVTPDATMQWFDPTLADWQASPVDGSGRGSAWFMNLAGQAAVLRQYRRGGMIARISRDRYIWNGLENSRSFHEFAVLAELTARGIRVARPIAALVCRVAGVFYRAALMTERIEQARPLWQTDDPEIWQRAGAAVALLHQQGVWHADLNVNNIQIDAQAQVWLIDFDRARMGIKNTQKLRGNLLRLERSVLKVCPEKHAVFWPQLFRGYEEMED